MWQFLSSNHNMSTNRITDYQGEREGARRKSSTADGFIVLVGLLCSGIRLKSTGWIVITVSIQVCVIFVYKTLVHIFNTLSHSCMCSCLTVISEIRNRIIERAIKKNKAQFCTRSSGQVWHNHVIFAQNLLVQWERWNTTDVCCCFWWIAASIDWRHWGSKWCWYWGSVVFKLFCKQFYLVFSGYL